jgi:hypothetical protein
MLVDTIPIVAELVSPIDQVVTADTTEVAPIIAALPPYVLAAELAS